MKLGKKEVTCEIKVDLVDATSSDVDDLIADARAYDHNFEITQKPGNRFSLWVTFGDDLTGARKLLGKLDDLAEDDS
ncbi:hypothetical protein ACIQ6Y_15210 [Streptomyces sp. NPDC096205]|uniref:hypothetical protein n=1 Tax=Streptomyces sp. NPDC096205 TaxID=3366081 RepID=UPI00382BE236